jgi:hypothetical protein
MNFNIAAIAATRVTRYGLDHCIFIATRLLRSLRTRHPTPNFRDTVVDAINVICARPAVIKKTVPAWV